jgi:hypothetical protein
MKPDTLSGYASKSVNFPRIGACRDTHQKMSIFQGSIPIENCQLSKNIDTHYTHYASKSVNFSRKTSTKSIYAKLVYQKKNAVTLQASHRGKEDGSGKGDTPSSPRSDAVKIRHAIALLLRKRGRCCRGRASCRFGSGNLHRDRAPPRPITTSSPGVHIPLWDLITPTATTTRTRTGNTSTVPEMRAVRTIKIGSLESNQMTPAGHAHHEPQRR